MPVIAVPQDQPITSSLARPRAFNTCSTATPKSCAATSVDTIGLLAAAGSLISVGRVEQP